MAMDILLMAGISLAALLVLSGFTFFIAKFLKSHFNDFQLKFHQGQTQQFIAAQDSLLNGLSHVRQQVSESLMHHSQTLNQQVDLLTQRTDQRLKEINQQVEARLSQGFAKTTETFHDVVKRLALIDEAQKKITELSTNVVGLQQLLSDKRSRGAFGEVQLKTLVLNLLPESHVRFQHTLSNDKRADCVLLLPEPTGSVVIDAKFPLENYKTLLDETKSESERRQAEQLFKQDIKKHILDIAGKYIIPGETADGAVMFIPAEAVFADIHARFPELVDLAHRERVWLTSPTTLMAVLTTARAVIKDLATREQVHLIQEHLVALSKDFDRFQKRMDNLSRHIQQAQEDVTEVQTSAQKITQRFLKIESIELKSAEVPEVNSVL